MNVFASILTGKNYISIVKEFIEKIFVHEARKFKCEPESISIILHRTKTNDIQIMVYSNTENRVMRIIPDKEAQEILTK